MIMSFLNPLKALLKGLAVVLKNALKPDVTLEYPEKKKPLNENFRGRIKYIKENCIKCGLCKKVCPVKTAIMIGEDFVIDYTKCIFCGNCTEFCPKNALIRTKEYELASKDKNNLIMKENINYGNN